MATEDNDNGSRPAMNRRKRLSASNATSFVVLVIGAVVAVNLIGTRVFGRLDLTENHVYTLSNASKEIVRALPDYLTVKAYISKDLPPELSNTSRYVRDLMDDYKTYSKGKLRFEAFDPESDKKIEDEANACKVQKLQIQVMRSQKFEVGTYWLGLCFQYQGKDDAIPEIGQVEGLEYEISSIIKRMTQKKRKVAFTTGHGEQDLTQGFTFLKHVVDQEFDSTTVNPSSTAIGDDVDALVVGGPKQAFDDKGRREIDRFLMKGRGVIFLVDGMTLSSPRGGMPQMAAQPKVGQANQTGLNELLEKYGFKIDEDFVFDRQNVPGPVDVGGRKMLKNLPVFVGVKTDPGRQGQLDPRRRERRRLPLPELRRAGRAAGQRQGADARRQALDAGRHLARCLEAERLLLLRAHGGHRGGQGPQGPRRLRAGLRLPGDL